MTARPGTRLRVSPASAAPCSVNQTPLEDALDRARQGTCTPDARTDQEQNWGCRQTTDEGLNELRADLGGVAPFHDAAAAMPALRQHDDEVVRQPQPAIDRDAHAGVRDVEQPARPHGESAVEPEPRRDAGLHPRVPALVAAVPAYQ